MVFFWATAVRSEELVVAAASVAFESGLGEVSSGKVMLHVMSLETKKFSLAGCSSQADKAAVIRTHQAAGRAVLAMVQGRCRSGQTGGSGSARQGRNPSRASVAVPALSSCPLAATRVYQAFAGPP